MPRHSRVDPRPALAGTHKVSFKLTKPKQSKTRYLSHSELTGIGMSVVLSFIIAVGAVFIVINGGPVVMRFFLDVINDLLEEPTATKAVTGNPTPPPRFLTLQNINCSYFVRKYENKDPIVFLANRELNTMKIVSEQYSQIPVKLEQLEQFVWGGLASSLYTNTPLHIDTFTMLVQEFQVFESTLNEDIISGNYFASSSAALELMPAITDILSPPSLPNSIKKNDKCSMRTPPFSDFRATMLTLATNMSSLSGGPFHAHRRSLSELLHGRKRWVIFPPDLAPLVSFNPSENLRNWRSYCPAAGSTAPTQPIEVIQEAGQVVYIPEGWYHATETLSPYSVSVRFEPPDELSGYHIYYLARGDQRAAEKDYAAAAKLYRVGLAMHKSSALVAHLAYALEQLGLFSEAEEAYREALERSPRDPLSYAALVNFLVSHSTRDASLGVSDLLQRADSYGIKGDVLSLLKDIF